MSGIAKVARRSSCIKSGHFTPGGLTARPALGLRHATTSTESLPARTKNVFLGSAIGLGILLGYLYATDTRAGMSHSLHLFLFLQADKSLRRPSMDRRTLTALDLR